MNLFELMLLSGEIIGIMYYLFNVKKEHGYVYARFPFSHKNVFGSRANPEEIKSGYKWTKVSDLKEKFKGNDVFIDNFRFDEDYAKKSKIPKWYKKKVENTAIHFNPIEMRESMLFVGKMGSGKTEILFNFLNQKFYNRAIIHQVKAGDFVEPYYREKIDIIMNPYDERGYLWDVMHENEGIIKTFFENYMNSVMGDKKDFFSSTGNRLFNETMIKIKTQYKNESSSVKWLLFIQAIKEMFSETESKTQNSKKDVASTMESILEPLEIMAWMMQDPNQKKFTIKEFFERKNQCKLILDNNAEFTKQLTPLFSAFISCVTQIHTSRPDTKTDFTLYAIDEYLSLVQTMDKDSKNRLHTLIRSKGGILMSFVQYIPAEDKKTKQLITSSAFAWFYFSVIDEDSINALKNDIGETEYYQYDVNESYSNGKKTRSYSTKKEKTHLITNEMINGLAEKYEHIVYIPGYKMLYKGYTPQAKLKKRAEKFVRRNLSEFYEMKYKLKNAKSKEEIRALTFADLFKEKPISKLEEYKLYKKFEKAKAEDKVQKFKKEENLENVDFELLFKEYIQDDTIISSKMEILTTKERLALATEWEKIKDDDAKAFEFIEKHQLWGACPGLFNQDLESLEDI